MAREIPRDRPVAFICLGGVRSGLVAQGFRAVGYDAYNVRGGFAAVVRARAAGRARGRDRRAALSLHAQSTRAAPQPEREPARVVRRVEPLEAHALARALDEPAVCRDRAPVWSTCAGRERRPRRPKSTTSPASSAVLREPLAPAMSTRPVVRRAPAEPGLVAAERVDHEARAVEPAVGVDDAPAQTYGRADLRDRAAKHAGDRVGHGRDRERSELGAHVRLLPALLAQHLPGRVGAVDARRGLRREALARRRARSGSCGADPRLRATTSRPAPGCGSRPARRRPRATSAATSADPSASTNAASTWPTVRRPLAEHDRARAGDRREHPIEQVGREGLLRGGTRRGRRSSGTRRGRSGTPPDGADSPRAGWARAAAAAASAVEAAARQTRVRCRCARGTRGSRARPGTLPARRYPVSTPRCARGRNPQQIS